MNHPTLRVLADGTFHDVPAPDWYSEASRLCHEGRLDWHRALDRVLDCDGIPLTEEGMDGVWLEILFWPSAQVGIFVSIETPLGFIEQVLVPKRSDWLPFLTTYLAPLIAASTQSVVAELHRKMANAIIAYARHGEGRHVDRETGLSRIDLDQDRARRVTAQARQAMAQSGKGGAA
jgi:hypothetical protein